MSAVLAKVNCCVLVGPIESDKRHAARVEEKLVAIEVRVAAMRANEGLSCDLVGVVAVHSSTKRISRVLETPIVAPSNADGLVSYGAIIREVQERRLAGS